jgi:hypothetical protein
VKYNQLSAVFVNAIAELQTQIKELQTQLEELRVGHSDAAKR